MLYEKYKKLTREPSFNDVPLLPILCGEMMISGLMSFSLLTALMCLMNFKGNDSMVD